MSDVTRTITTRLRLEGEGEYNNQLKQISTNMSGLKSEMAKLAAEYDGQLNSYEALTKKGSILGRQLDEQRAKQGVLSTALKEAVAARDAFNAEVAKTAKLLADEERAGGKSSEKHKELSKHLGAQVEGAARAANTIADYKKKLNYAEADLIKLSRAVDDNNKYLSETGGAAGGAATSIDGYGKAVKEAADKSEELGEKGASGVNALAAALAAAGVAKSVKEIADALRDCVDASIEFESAMTGVYKTVEGTDAQLAKITSGIKEMSAVIPLSASELASIAEGAGQLGIRTDDVLAFTEVMAKLGAATDLTSEQAATMLAQLANVTGLDASQYENLASAIVDLGNNSATTESKIVQMAQGMAGAATVAGFSEADIVALAASVSSLGIESQAGASSMSKLITELQLAVETGKGLNDFASVAGVSAERFAQMWGAKPVEALGAFVQGLNDTERNGKSALAILDEMGLSEVRLSRAVTQLAKSGDLLSSSVARANKAWSENTALTREAAQRFETTESKMQLLDNSVNMLRVSIGDALLPALNKLAEAGINVAQWAAEFIEKNEWLVPTVVALAAALGVGAVALGGYTLAVNVAIPAITAFNAALAANPIGAVVLALVAGAAAIGAFIALLKDSDKELNDFRGSLQAIGDTQKAAEAETLAASSVAERYVERLRELERQGLETAEAQREYESIVALLNRTVPGLNAELDAQTGLIKGGTEALWETVAAWKEAALAQAMYNAGSAYIQAVADATVALKEAEIDLVAAGDELAAAKKRQADETEKYNQLIRDSAEITNADVYALEGHSYAVEVATGNERRMAKALEDAKTALSEAEGAARKYEGVYRDVIGVNDGAAGSAGDSAQAFARQGKAIDELLPAVKALSSELKTLESAFAEQAKAGELSLDTMLKVIDAGYAAALSVDKETGAVYLNEAAYLALANAKLAEQRATLQTAVREATALATRLEGEAAALAADGYRELAYAKYAEMAASKAEMAGIEAALAALENAAARVPAAAARAGGGGGAQKKDKTQAELDLEAFREAQAELKELRADDLLSAMEYYSRLSELSAKYLQDPKNSAEQRRVANELRGIYGAAMSDALEAVKLGYLSMEEAAEVFGLSVEQIADRHSAEKLYSEQMRGAVDAVKSGTMTIFAAMKQYEVGYEDLAKALATYTSDMRRLYDAQRDVLDYHYKMGLVSAEEYYRELTRLRDEFLEENSQAWRAATLEMNSLMSEMGKQALNDAQNAQRELEKLLKERIDERKKQIDKELALEKERLNKIIAGINAEIQARRNLRADEGSEDAIRKAQERVRDAERSLAAAEAQMQYARDDAARAEAEKLMLQRQKALKEAQDALERSQQDYKDQLWYREKQQEIDNVKAEIAGAEKKAGADKDRADAQAAREAAMIAAEAAAKEMAISMATNAAAAAAGAASAIMTSLTKNANVNVTYTNASATSGQVAALVAKALDKL